MKRGSVGMHGVVVCLVGAFVACVGDDPSVGPRPDGGSSDAAVPSTDAGTTPDPADGAVVPDASAAPVVSVTSPPTPLRVGESLTLAFSIERRGLEGELPIVVTGLPSGVTATAATFATGASTASIELSATAEAVVGEAALQIEVVGATAASYALLVAGPSGVFDTTFDNDGMIIDVTNVNGVFFAVTLEADRSVLAAGAVNGAAGNGGWVLKRYRADGAPDSDFNTAASNALPTTGSARGIALEPQTGKIVVVGSSGATERLTIVRLNPNGTTDDAFANAGTMVVDSVRHSNDSRALAVQVLADSKVLVAGWKTQGGSAYGIVERYTVAGVLDENYASFTTADSGQLTGLLPFADGAFAATGTRLSSPPAQLVVRLLANGTPDATFAGGSRTYASRCRGAASALTTNGDLVIAGQSVAGPSFCVTRVAMASSGNQAWSQTIGGGNSEQFTAAATGPNGTTYAIGNGGGSQDKLARIERRDAAGELDPSFATTGVLELADPAVPDTFGYRLQAATTTADGRLVVVGNRTTNKGYFVGRIWP